MRRGMRGCRSSIAASARDWIAATKTRSINFLLFGTTFTRLSSRAERQRQGWRAASGRPRSCADGSPICQPPSRHPARTSGCCLFAISSAGTASIQRPPRDANRRALYLRTLMTRIVGEVDGYARTIQSARGAPSSPRDRRSSARAGSRPIRPSVRTSPSIRRSRRWPPRESSARARCAASRVIGPGLDFTDKAEGHDFYPAADHAAVLGDRLAAAAGAGARGRPSRRRPSTSTRGSTAISHARAAARALGNGLCRCPAARSRRQMAARARCTFWKSFGRRIGDDTRAAPPPRAAWTCAPSACARTSCLTSTPRDVNVVVERLVATETPTDSISSSPRTSWSTTTCSSSRWRSPISRRCCVRAASCSPTTSWSNCPRHRCTRSATARRAIRTGPTIETT